jgi:SPW repeat-containing protein
MAATERQRLRTRAPRNRDTVSHPPVTDPMSPGIDPVEPAPPPRPAGDWRAAVATASGLNVLAGIWLIIAPFVLGYRGGDPIWNDVVFGAIVAILGLVRVSGAYRAAELSWVNAIVGAWIFVSAFWLDASGTASANDIIFGIVVFVLALASATATEDAAWYRR